MSTIKSMCSWCSSEKTWAFLIVRLFLALRAFFAGIEKFELNMLYSFENYYENMGRMAQGISASSFLPMWMSRIYAYSLGYILIVLGVLLLLGVKSRAVLVLHGLMYVSLAFGLMAVQEAQGISWLGVHIILTVIALLLVREEKLALWPSCNTETKF